MDMIYLIAYTITYVNWCGRRELEPPRALNAQRIFVPATAFAARHGGVCGLDYPFTVAAAHLGAARLVSTPSSLPGLARDCHVTGSPEFGQFCICGFPARALKATFYILT